LAVVCFGGGRLGLVWRQPTSYARGGRAQEEAAVGGGVRGCCGSGRGGSSLSLQISAGSAGVARWQRLPTELWWCRAGWHGAG
jgi:hypothetical protein